MGAGPHGRSVPNSVVVMVDSDRNRRSRQLAGDPVERRRAKIDYWLTIATVVVMFGLFLWVVYWGVSKILWYFDGVLDFN